MDRGRLLREVELEQPAQVLPYAEHLERVQPLAQSARDGVGQIAVERLERAAVHGVEEHGREGRQGTAQIVGIDTPVTGVAPPGEAGHRGRSEERRVGKEWRSGGYA